ncbi:hypothetical protein CLIB1444_01S05974 [[Candida] jaroonii]|uniref:Uncharacterized protein n=1 Tax=[Candida] jaroonii TaxID=467808 RepID=A0ACA9Y0L1_9ASCO|nr:hypothetical protein CLIB1444_01S05974 [[Candida] jaroonii]
MLKAIFLFITLSNCLNIILSTSDSWVTKNVRSLYQDLINDNHHVLLVGPLYQTSPIFNLDIGQSPHMRGVKDDDFVVTDSKDINDGGDFDHLIPSNQMFYKNMKKLNFKRVKNIPSKVDMKRDLLPQIDNDYFGNDPLDKNCWFVNSANPINVLSIFMDNLMPKYYPDFQPDMILFGPLESHDNDQEILNEVSKFANFKNIPSITISTSDNKHVYYNEVNGQLKQITKFINAKVSEMMNQISTNKLPDYHSVSIKFPKYLNSYCLKEKNDFKFLNYNQLFNLDYNHFELNDSELRHKNVTTFNLLEKDPQNDIRLEREDNTRRNQNVYKIDDTTILDSCDIPVRINYLYQLDSKFNYNFV